VSAVLPVVEARPRQIHIIAGYAAIVGAVSLVLGVSANVFSGGGMDWDVPALGRASLGLLGVAGAVLLWTRPRIGWVIVLTWAALQIPYFAWSTDGSPLAQALYLPLTIFNETRRRPSFDVEIWSYIEYGVNLVGVVLTVAIHRWRNDWLNQRR
jgi:hypothetical protein